MLRYFFSFLSFLFLLVLPAVGLEADLEHPVAEGVPVERLDGHQALVVVGHGDEAEALALVGLQVADHLDVLDGAEGAEQLPQDVLLRLRGQVVDEDTPAAAVHGGGGGCGGGGAVAGCAARAARAGQADGVAGQEVAGQW